MNNEILKRLNTVIEELNKLETIIAKDFSDGVDSGKIDPYSANLHGDTFRIISIVIINLLSAKYKIEHSDEVM